MVHEDFYAPWNQREQPKTQWVQKSVVVELDELQDICIMVHFPTYADAYEIGILAREYCNERGFKFIDVHDKPVDGCHLVDNGDKME